MIKPASIKNWPYTKAAYITVVACWVGYATLTLIAPSASNARYHLNELELIILKLSVILPVHLIWLIAVHGTVTLKKYATMIQDGAEGKAFNDLANGLLLAVVYLILGTLIAATQPFITDQRLLNLVAILRDHVPALIALIAFALVYRGSHQLRLIANFSTWTLSTGIMLVGFLVFTLGFALDFNLSPNTVQADGVRNSLMILPHGLLIFTLVIPYLAAWFMGLLASINIAKYATRVKGVVYRQALKNLVFGIWGVIFVGVVIQAVTFTSRFLADMSLGLVLLIIYALLVLYGTGFIFIRSGAKKLAKIEVVQ